MQLDADENALPNCSEVELQAREAVGDGGGNMRRDWIATAAMRQESARI
jgi:hypothetical protein